MKLQSILLMVAMMVVAILSTMNPSFALETWQPSSSVTVDPCSSEGLLCAEYVDSQGAGTPIITCCIDAGDLYSNEGFSACQVAINAIEDERDGPQE